MMMSAMGQVPVLGQFSKGVVFYFPARVPQITNDRAGGTVQVPRDNPNPVLFLFFLRPLGILPVPLEPLLSHSNHPHRSGISVGEANRRHIPDLDFALFPL